jgi:photosystem II stability/assembly factor-like uncharacterized protein
MSLKGTVWTPIGPSPITEGSSPDNGMVTAIAPNPNNANIIYIGTAGGGVWRTRDGGTTWTPIFDRQLALGIGEPAGIAIDPNNTDILYVGTSQRVMLGTGNTGIFGAPDSSQGLFKSTDAGDSWIQLGAGFPAGNTGNAINFLGQEINVVIVDPANSNNLYLASSSGLFSSTDAGQNWTAGTGASGDARSLVLDPSSPSGARILYAGITNVGAFRSADGGLTWTNILSGSTPAVSAAIVAPTTGFSKVIIAMPPPTSPPHAGGIQVLYVTLSGTGGTGLKDPIGVFISKDQGSTWSQQAASGMPQRTQGGYSFHMAIDPASPGDGLHDIIYFGTVSQGKSTDSGASFSSLSVLHADTHSWAFFPQTSPTPSIVFCGNDGGIDTSTDGGSSWSSLNAGNFQAGLFFNIDVKPDAAASVVVGSAQDNGLQTTAGAVSPDWVSQGADGFDIAYDGVTPSQVYGTSGFWPPPCTRLFVSTDDAQTFPTNITPWGTTSDQSCGVFPVATDPSNAGHLYVSGNQNLWQTRDGGSTWRILSAFATTGDVDVAAADGNNVVIAVGNQVFVTTNALGAAPTFTNITRNLPSRNVARAKFDPVDPTVLYAVLGGLNGAGPGQAGHVFRTTLGASSWTDISPATLNPPAQLDLPCNAIALDGTDVPTTLYVGTDLGVLRSTDVGASWSVLDDIHFPRVTVSDLILNQKAGILVAGTYGRGVFKFTMPTGPVIAVELEDDLDFGTVCSGPVDLTLTVTNVGVADLLINSVQRLMGSTDFTVLPTPGTPLIVAPGDSIDFTIQYLPTAPGLEAAIIRITSNDPTAPNVDVAAFGAEGVSAIATAIANSGNFGNVCPGSFADEILTINNPGDCPLSISGITSSASEFEVPGVVSYPLVVDPGTSIDLVLRFQPSVFGSFAGTFTVSSNAPGSPNAIFVSGTAPAPLLSLIIANTGNFGNVCVGCFRDEPLILTNTGKCLLTVTGITSSSGEFLVPSVSSWPVTISPGNSLDLPIRFEPTSFGATAATITVFSNDPAGPRTVDVSGNAPSGTLAVTGSLCFGGVKACSCAERTIAICNVGPCPLHVTSVAFKRKNPHWRLIHNPFPATLYPGSCLNVVIRYKATEKCPRCCEMVITSDDPETPVKILEVLAYTDWNRRCCKDGCEKCSKECSDPCNCCCGECGENCCDDDDCDDKDEPDPI